MQLAPTSTQAIELHTGASAGLAHIAGNQIYYEVAGQGLPVVFLHDGNVHRNGFDAQQERFSQNYTVVRYDRPGFGDSPPPTKAHSDVATLKGILDFLGIEAVILVGGSAGGRLALNFALEHPAAVGALVLVGAAVSGFAFTDHMRYRGWRNVWGASIAEMTEFWLNDPWYIAPENHGARDRLRQLLLTYPHNLVNFPVQKLDDGPAIDRLAEIQTPTLVLAGESDIADNHAHAGVIQLGIKDSERQIIIGAGHLAYLEQPDQFNRLVLEFLDRRLSRPVA